MAVLTGDIQTDNDARRLARYGFPVRQITTGGACHLDARMVERALADWRSDDLEILFLENVGNLVCPTSYDLGEEARAVLLSVTEGEDKPLKYPATFHHADLMVLNKIDLLPYVPFSMDLARENARRVQPEIEILEVSCTTGRRARPVVRLDSTPLMTDYPVINGLIFCGLGILVFVIAFSLVLKLAPLDLWKEIAKSAMSRPPSWPARWRSDCAGSSPPPCTEIFGNRQQTCAHVYTVYMLMKIRGRSLVVCLGVLCLSPPGASSTPSRPWPVTAPPGSPAIRRPGGGPVEFAERRRARFQGQPLYRRHRRITASA